MQEVRKWNRKLWLLGLIKIPMIAFVRPRVVLINSERCELRIKNRRRTRNHLNSMYFGALAVGADVAPGLLTFYLVEKQGMQINFAFKSMKAEFLKRAETDVTFICEASEAIRNALRQSMEENERVNLIVEVRAMDELNAEVAYFEMELSFRATLR